MAGFRFLVLGLLALFAVSGSLPAAAEVRTYERESILVEVLGSKFETFVSLLEHAELLGVLEKEFRDLEGATMFMPSDFYLANKVSPALLSFLRQPNNLALLQKILLFHFLPHRIGTEDWGSTFQTLEGSEISLDVEAGVYEVEGAPVREFEALTAADGVVHAISGFLVPAGLKPLLKRFTAERPVEIEVVAYGVPHFVRRSLADTTAAAPAPSVVTYPVAPAPGPSGDDLTLLIDALRARGGYDTFLNLLASTGLDKILASYDGPLTLLVPNDKAFAGIPASSLAVLTKNDDLLDVLKYHVITSKIDYNQLLAGGTGKTVVGTVTTLSGLTLPVNSDNGTLSFGNPPVAVNSPNIVDSSSNELSVQGLDGVLIPPGLLAPSPAPTQAPTQAPPSPPPKSSGLQHAVDTRVLLAGAVGLAFAFVL